ncbi:MAG: hypothetical protein ACR2N4_03470 [Jatrophihabitans sp.]
MRTAIRAAGLVIAVGASSLIVASPASAAPGSCAFYRNPSKTTGGVLCTSGSGTYYAHITCTDELRGSNSYINGPRVNIGTGSAVVCPKEGGVQFIATAGVAYYP